jgi:hypothetical protein
MAYDSINKRLYVDEANGKGITLAEIAMCLGDYRLNGRGQRDLGMLCRSENVNPDSMHRPYEVGVPVPTNLATGGNDGQFGYDIPMTSNNNVRVLWGRTWSDKGRPTTWGTIRMFDGYWHDASFDLYPFGITISQAGDHRLSVQYNCRNDIRGSVNPAHMDKFKDYYPALQIFEEDTAATGAKNIACFNWCGSKKISEGVSGELVDLGNIIDSSKTYYIIPFLSQYRFNTTTGDMGTLNGDKFCLIYKDFNEQDWIIGVTEEETIYSAVLNSLTMNGTRGASVQFTLSSKQKEFTAFLYAGYRVFDEVNGVESVWYDAWNPSLQVGQFKVAPATPVTSSFNISWGGNSISENATRIEVRLYDPSKSTYWSKSFNI